MPIERLFPDAILASTNLTGTISDIQDDPTSPDADWLTASSISDNILRVSYPTPSGTLNGGFGNQSVVLWVRKSASGGNDPLLDVDLYEGGAFVFSLAIGLPVTSSTGQTISLDWDAGSLADLDGPGVEIVFSGSRTSGSPSSRRTVEYGALAWDADYQSTSPVGSLTGTEGIDTPNLSGAVTATGQIAASELTDVALLPGNLPSQGGLAAVEALDLAGLTGTVANPAASGPLAVIEPIDAADMSGAIRLTGNLIAAELGDDASASGTVLVTGTGLGIEASDGLALTGTVQQPAVTGVLSASEGVDAASFAAETISVGVIAAVEATDDKVAAGIVQTQGAVVAVELTDSGLLSGGSFVSGAMPLAETSDNASLTGPGASASGAISTLDPGDAIFAVSRLISNAPLVSAEMPDGSDFTGRGVAGGTLLGAEAADQVAFLGVGAGVSGVFTGGEIGDAVALSIRQISSGALVTAANADGAAIVGQVPMQATVSAADVADTALFAGSNGSAAAQLIVENTIHGISSQNAIAGCASQHRITT